MTRGRPIILEGYRIFRDEAGEAGTGEAGGGGDAGGGSGNVELPEGAFMSADFRNALPEDIREHDSLAKIGNLEEMTRSYISGQRMLGADPKSLVTMPDLTDNVAVGEFLTKLGAPETVDGYTLAGPEGVTLPDWLAPSEPLAKGFAEKAHELQLLPHQVAGIYEWFSGDMTKLSTDQQQAEGVADEEAVRGLKAEWGPAFDQNLQAAELAIDKLGGQDLRAALNDSGLGVNPAVLKALSQVGKMLAEDTSTDGEGNNAFTGTLAPAEAKAKGREFAALALNETDPEKKRKLSADAQRFFKLASPGEVSA